MEGNTQFNLENIILIESRFKRNPDITSEDNLKLKVDFVVNHEVKENKLGVELKVELNAVKGSEKTVKVTALVKMLGIFKFSEIPEYGLEQFSEINAAAIIFPFVREHLASVSIKAGIPPVLLPPVNFVELYKDQHKEDTPKKT